MSRTVAVIVALALVIAAAGVRGYNLGKAAENAEWVDKWSTESDKLSKERISAIEAALLAERQARAKALEAVNHAHERSTQAAASHFANGAAADRLRLEAIELSKRSARMPNAATLADRSAAATRAALVLSGLLDRSIQTNRELALAYDAARIAGETCQRINATP